ncbi:MAG: ABC transporter substrate-binding protein [Candidatus Hermodarchaeota archaeon]
MKWNFKEKVNQGKFRKKSGRGILLFLIILLFIQPRIISVIHVRTTFIDAFPAGSPLGTLDSTNKIIQQTPELPSILKMGDHQPLIEDIGDFFPLGYYRIAMKSLIYETLVEYSVEEKEFLPCLAYQWTVTSDSKHWSFYLRDDVLFHDGSRFNASAVKFSAETALAIGTPDAFIESIEIVNEYLVTFHFYDSYANFMNTLAQVLPIFSPNCFDGETFINPIGTGPYSINLTESNSSFVQFNRFTLYYQGLSPFEEIHFKIYPSDPLNDTQFEEDILSKSLDFIGSGNSIEPEEDDPYWKRTMINAFPIITFGHFNHHRSELTDPNVRKAINYAINKEEFALNTFKLSQPLNSVVPEGILGHDSSIEGYPYDLTKANLLLDQAGYVRDENDYRFNIDLAIRPGLSIPDMGIEVIKESLEKVGIKCTITEDQNYWDVIGEYNIDFDIAIVEARPFDPGEMHWYLHSEPLTGFLNLGGYSNEKVDLFFDSGRKTPVSQEREFYYQQIQNIAQEESPFLLLSQRVVYYWKSAVTSPYFYLSPANRIKFNYSLPVDQSRFRITQVEIPTDVSLYLPTTDSIVSNNYTDSIVLTMQMSRELELIYPNLQASGKFFTLETTDQNTVYNFRCYYDFDEIRNLSVNELALFQYNDQKSTWERLSTVSANSSLRYIEVNLQGGFKLLRLGSTINQITFLFIPLFSLIILGLVGVAVYTLVGNTRLARKFRTEMFL